MSTSIGEQAENYAEVITGQIVANFDELATAMVECKELKDAKKAYEKTSPLDNAFTTIDTLQERVKIIEDNLGDIVCDDYNSIEPLAVGLFGEWGSGKTHQLKLIKKHLLVETREEDAATIIPVFFNAWRFEKEEHIILPLFQTLLDAVENHERTLKDKAKRGFKSTAYHLKNVLFSLHHGISWSSAYKTVQGVVTNNLEDMREVTNVVDMKTVQTKGKGKTNKEQVGEQSLTQLLQPDQLQSIYLNIPQWIEKITLFENVNFVFLIDDLDRCLPENTLKMLESIKLFLDVPSCAFVLAVDDDVVERGVVHHYRDYLSIYHHNDTKGSQSVMQHELPITGHEYLEKMIQLPIRLPVIDTVNIGKFLEEHSRKWMKLIDEKDNPRGLPLHIGVEGESPYTKGQHYRSPTSSLLHFFKNIIPPKPRKIKRTAKLFESKIELLYMMGLEGQCSYELLAKITLLELFAPKILRFIQNNDYAETYRALCDFHYVNDSEKKEKRNTLYDTKDIIEYIKKEDSNYTQEKQDKYIKLIDMVSEHHSSRMVFDLSAIFNQTEEYEALKVAIEYREVTIEEKINRNISETSTLDKEIMEQLFLENNPETWGATLREYNRTLSIEQVTLLIKEAKKRKDSKFNNLPFIANPEWIGQLSKFVGNEEYKTLLLASHNACFKVFDNADEKKQIDMFQLTFAEYDKYCELTEKGQRRDEGWGRGRRPIIDVSWQHAKEYVDWLNDFMEDNYIYGLPGEEEWTLVYSYKEDIKKYAWYNDNSNGKTHAVGEKKSNQLGFYDIRGNVWEWCEDGSNQYIDEKILYGGSWESDIKSILKIDSLVSERPTYRSYDVGFRLMRTLH